MYVLCTECRNHYDDSFQVKRCDREASGVGAPNPYHRSYATKPVTEANAATRALRAAQRVGRARSWVFPGTFPHPTTKQR